MKLKKLLALALAGVMAVSMLAGCKKGENKPEDPTGEPTSVTADAVIAALDEDAAKKVTLTASSALASTAEKAAQYVGAENIDDIEVADLKKFDDKLSSQAKFSAVTAAYKDADKGDETITVVIVSDALNKNYGATYIVESLADKIEAEALDNSNYTAANLPTYTGDTTNADGDDCYYKLAYAGDMAIVEVEDADDANSVKYVVVITLNRTATETPTPTK